MLMGGIDGEGGHLYYIRDPGTYESVDKVGFVAIGTGGRHAELTFIQNGFRPTATLGEAIFISYLAKKNAEHAPGVGSRTDMAIISKEGYFEINEGDELLKYLDGIVENLNSQLQSSKTKIQDEVMGITELLKR